ncbi:Paf1 complex component [Microbotryomycetes sp. JL221]|nr:Paf1 complex component [Microbotryomycetes sp. JL221]
MDVDTYPTADLGAEDENTFGHAVAKETMVAAAASSMLDRADQASNRADEDNDDDDDGDDDDLFGDKAASDDDMNDSEAAPQTQPPAPLQYDEGLTEEERKRRQELEYEEGDEPALQETTQVAQVSIATQAVPRGAKVWHARLPNFMSLEHNPFTPAWRPPATNKGVVNPAQEDENMTEAPVPDENVIRWRWRDAGNRSGQNPKKQSNSRIVRWSDGTYSLQLGAELFDITMAVDRSASQTNGANPVPQPTSDINISSHSSDSAHSLTFLTSQHEYTGLIEAQASVYGTLSFRPTTLQSSTHRRLAGSIAARNVKGRAVRRLDIPSADPERLKAEREKAELEKVRKSRKQRARTGEGSRRRQQRKQTKLEGVSDDEGHDDEEDAGDDNDDTRGSYDRRRRHYDDFEEGDDDNFIVADDAVDSGEEDLDEVDEAEDRIARNARNESRKDDADEAEPAPAPRRRLVVDDSDDD